MTDKKFKVGDRVRSSVQGCPSFGHAGTVRGVDTEVVDVEMDLPFGDGHSAGIGLGSRGWHFFSDNFDALEVISGPTETAPAAPSWEPINGRLTRDGKAPPASHQLRVPGGTFYAFGHFEPIFISDAGDVA